MPREYEYRLPVRAEMVPPEGATLKSVRGRRRALWTLHAERVAESSQDVFHPLISKLSLAPSTFSPPTTSRVPTIRNARDWSRVCHHHQPPIAACRHTPPLRVVHDHKRTRQVSHQLFEQTGRETPDKCTEDTRDFRQSCIGQLCKRPRHRTRRYERQQLDHSPGGMLRRS